MWDRIIKTDTVYVFSVTLLSSASPPFLPTFPIAHSLLLSALSHSFPFYLTTFLSSCKPLLHPSASISTFSSFILLSSCIALFELPPLSFFILCSPLTLLSFCIKACIHSFIQRSTKWSFSMRCIRHTHIHLFTSCCIITCVLSAFFTLFNPTVMFCLFASFLQSGSAYFVMLVQEYVC